MRWPRPIFWVLASALSSLMLEDPLGSGLVWGLSRYLTQTKRIHWILFNVKLGIFNVKLEYYSMLNLEYSMLNLNTIQNVKLGQTIQAFQLLTSSANQIWNLKNGKSASANWLRGDWALESNICLVWFKTCQNKLL